MSLSFKTISSGATELEFINSFISALTAEDSRITCSTSDLSTQFADNDAYPTFIINLGDIPITFKRSAKSNSGAYYYYISALDTDLNYWQVRFRGDTKYATDTAARTFKYGVMKNNNALVLRIGGFETSVTDPDTTAVSYKGVREFLLLTSGLSSYGARSFRDSSSSASVMDSSLFSLPYSGSSATYTAYDRLNYTNNGNNPYSVERIVNKAFLGYNTTNKALTVTSLQDTSTVIRNQVIKIGSKMYYTIDDHTIMEV